MPYIQICQKLQRHTGTQTHRHTDTQHTHTQAQKDKQAHRHMDTNTHSLMIHADSNGSMATILEIRKSDANLLEIQNFSVIVILDMLIAVLHVS